ncbi:MAG: hypothetical protein IKX40_03600 [Thermoguttaceae bacterium]|nr:hypothetical protein [Thermoguttaceae bacterium]
MDTEDSNSTPQTDRDKLNDQLDELRESQQDPTDFDDIANDTPRSWWTYLWWGLCAVGGLFLFWRTSCTPQVTCYVIKTIPDRGKIPVQEPDDSPEIMCYDFEFFDNSEPESAPEPAPAESEPEQEQ